MENPLWNWTEGSLNTYHGLFDVFFRLGTTIEKNDVLSVLLFFLFGYFHVDKPKQFHIFVIKANSAIFKHNKKNRETVQLSLNPSYWVQAKIQYTVYINTTFHLGFFKALQKEFSQTDLNFLHSKFLSNFIHPSDCVSVIKRACYRWIFARIWRSKKR